MPHDENRAGIWDIFTADMVRYAGEEVRPWSLAFLRRLAREAYVHPGLIAVVVYRYGQWSQGLRVPVVRQMAELGYYYWFNWVRSRLGIELPRNARIGPGLRIDHFGGILINSQVTVGKNLTLNQGTLLGQTDTGFPCLGDNVALGVGARIIGGITIGSNVLVGCGAVVTRSTPDNAVLAGVPARILRIRDEKS